MSHVTSDSDGWYPEQPPRFKVPGTFEAFLKVTDNSDGSSKVSWEVMRQGRKIVVAKDTKVSMRGTSGQNRAYLGGVAGILEALAPGSTATIHCGMEYVVNILNEGLEVWLARKGKDVPNRDIWQRILKVLKERKLTVVAVHWSNESNQHNDISVRLAKRVKRAVAKKPRVRKS